VFSWAGRLFADFGKPYDFTQAVSNTLDGEERENA